MFLDQDVKNPAVDFKGLFEPSAKFSDYMDKCWNNLINIFKAWFGRGSLSGNGVVWSKNTTLPLFSGATSFQTDYLSGKVVDLRKLIIRHDNYKSINGFKERVQDDSNKEYITMEYVGFNESVKFLAEQYFSDDKYELKYAKGSNPSRQVIQIVNPKQHGINKYGKSKIFEPLFSWQILGSLVNLNGKDSPNKIHAKMNDGVVDLGEFCDTDNSGKIFFKFNNNSCHFWNSTYTQGNVTCYNNRLNFKKCIS